MKIEDDELREVFKTASEEHLQKLDHGLLALEKHPEDLEKLEELLRETHSLKGDAGMLGLKDIATLSHQLEHLLGGIKRKEIVMSPEISDRFSQGLHAIGLLCNEAVTGEPSGVVTFYVLATLLGANAAPPATPPSTEVIPKIDTPVTNQDANVAPVIESTEAPPPQEQTQVAPVVDSTEAPPPQDTTKAAPVTINPPPEPENDPQEPAITQAKTTDYKIETIRVATQNLDTLMTETGELTVTKTRLAHRELEIQTIVSLWEEWNRDLVLHRAAWQTLEKNLHSDDVKEGSWVQVSSLNRRFEERLEKMGILISNLQNNIHEDTTRLNIIVDDLDEGVRTLRLLPLSTIFSLFPRLVRDLSRQQNKEVELILEGSETRADKQILEKMKDALMHMIRNSIDHGIETTAERIKAGKNPVAKIRLKGYSTSNNIIIEVIDDGRGLDTKAIKKAAIARHICTEESLATMTENQIHNLIFEPGFSTRTFVTEISGRGVGMDVVRANVAALKGTVEVESKPGKGCIFRVYLSTTLATAHVLLIEVNSMIFALPAEFVQTIRIILDAELFTIENKQVVALDNQPVPVVKLADLLGLPTVNNTPSHTPLAKQENVTNSGGLYCLFIKVGNERIGLFVDDVLDTQNVVLKPQSKLLKRVRNMAGATILGTGEVCIVLNAQDLVKSVAKFSGNNQSSLKPTNKVIKPHQLDAEQQFNLNQKKVILLAEDSIAVRTQEKRILEGAGYEVVLAVDGLDAWNKLKNRQFDAVVSDVQMPNLDGLSLTKKIRENQEYEKLPIILVTSMATDEDKKRGAEAGANGYIPKGTFSQDILLETLKRLV